MSQNSLIQTFISNFILKRFFEIPLTSVEREIAEDSVKNKYCVALVQSAIYSILLIPSLLLLDTEIVVSVLIPTTMVAGTAWFSVSLASMKKKFENFGTELTTDLFVAFTLSLIMLFLATGFSLTSPLWISSLEELRGSLWLSLISAILALIVVGKLLFSIFSGSLKYDVNDAMLTGQNEAAERFFKKSLSLLHAASEALKMNRHLEVANYTIGVAFFEVFTNINNIQGDRYTDKNMKSIDQANKLISTPAMSQTAADDIARGLVREFLDICDTSSKGDLDVASDKSYKAIVFELDCLEKNTEDQEMVDTRMSVIFSEISNLIEEFGPQLFSSED